MKTVKNIFGSKNTNNTMNNFSERLDINAMLKIKGGDDPDNDGDIWPPSDPDGSKVNS